MKNEELIKILKETNKLDNEVIERTWDRIKKYVEEKNEGEILLAIDELMINRNNIAHTNSILKLLEDNSNKQKER